MKTEDHSVTIELADIEATTDNGIWVRLKATGKLAWLPRSMTQFMPGIAIVPRWLAEKILPSGHGAVS